MLIRVLIALCLANCMDAQIYRDSSNYKLPYELIVLKSSTKRQTLNTLLNVSNRCGHFLLFHYDKLSLMRNDRSLTPCLTKSVQVIPQGYDEDVNLSFDVGNDSSVVRIICPNSEISTERVGAFEPFMLRMDFGKGYVGGALRLHIKDVVIRETSLRVTLQISYTGPHLLTFHFVNVSLASEDFGIRTHATKRPTKHYYTPGEKAELVSLEFPIPSGFNPTQKSWLEFKEVFEELGLSSYPGFTLEINRSDLSR